MDAGLQKFLKTLAPYQKTVKKVLLFGSRARGEERPESDYDLLILVKKRDRQMINRLYDGVLDCLLETGRLISLKIFTEEEWQYLSSLKTPFSQAVNREGVSLG